MNFQRNRMHRPLPLAIIVASLLGVPAAYWQSYGQMVDMWSLQTYQYGWLVLPISITMLWHSRVRISAVRLESSALGLAALALIVLAWFMAAAANVQVVTFLASTLLVPALAWALGGTALIRAALFPLLFLVAAVPVGEAFIPALMEITADISTVMLDAVGVPAYREGNFITLPGGQFEVADVCSGLRYLLVGTVLGILFAYWNYRSYAKRILFVLSLGLVLIVANGIRAFVVMYVASATEMRVFAGHDHVVFGQLLFVCLVAAVMWLGSRYAEDTDDSAQVAGPAETRWRPVVMIVAVVVLVLGPVGRQLYTNEHLPAELPLTTGTLHGCAALDEWSPDWQPRLAGPAVQAKSSWQCGEVVISLYQAAYRRQQQGMELISAENRIWPHAWRRRAEIGRQRLAANGREIPVVEVFRPQEPVATLVWYFYDVDGRRTSSTFFVKWLEALNALRLHTPNSALVVIVAEGTAERSALASAAERATAGI